MGMLFSGKVQDEFNVKEITSKSLEKFINDCANIYKGNPKWLGDGENIKSINMARSVCQETARLTMLASSIKAEGSDRAEWIQERIDNAYVNLRNWIEFACAYGTIILKPTEDGEIDIWLPDQYMITAQDHGKVTGIVFVDKKQASDKYYTRFEYHRFIEEDAYLITNKCFVGESENDLSKTIGIENTPWKDLDEEVRIDEITHPLYAVLKMPGANFIDEKSPLGLPMFRDALEELRDLDIAYSRNSEEIYDSERIVLLDADKLLPGKDVQKNTFVQKNTRKQMELPKYIRNVMGNGQTDFYKEINPTLNTPTRLEGINSYLSQVGFKCGFSNGYFVLDQKTGMVTATQVESDDRRTIQTIKDVRDQVEASIKDLCEALNMFADLYELAPDGEYELTFGFGDITYNYQEDKAMWWLYVTQGKVPFWRYLVKFENMTEEEAKEIEAEVAQQQAQQAGMAALFGNE